MLTDMAYIKPLRLFICTGTQCFEVDTQTQQRNALQMWIKIFGHGQYKPGKSRILILVDPTCAPPDDMTHLSRRMQIVANHKPRRIAVATHGNVALRLFKPFVALLQSKGIPAAAYDDTQKAIDFVLR